MTKKKYTGVLARRLPQPKYAEIEAAEARHDSAEVERLLDESDDQICQRFEALAKHFEVDLEQRFEKVLFKLVFKLAETHVPGFQHVKTKGAPKKWNTGKRLEAAFALGRLMATHENETQTKLAKRMLQTEPWASLSAKPEALLKQIRLLRSDNLDEYFKDFPGLGSKRTSVENNPDGSSSVESES